MGYPRQGYDIGDVYDIGDIIELGEDHLRYLLEQAWDAGYEAAEGTDKLRRWQQPVNVENPYRKED